MITINLEQKTNQKGHLVVDVPTNLINKNVEVVMVIQEKGEMFSEEREIKKKFDFSHLFGKLEWKGDALAEQKKIRSEWE